MISCISPSYFCFEETLNTLNYSSRAKNIKRKVSKNLREVENQYFKYKEILQNLLINFEFVQDVMKQPCVCGGCGKMVRAWSKEYSFVPANKTIDKRDWGASFEALCDMERSIREEVEAFTLERKEK